MNTVVGEGVERELQVADPRALEALNRSEIDVQIATAKRFPRSVTKFHAEATSLVTLSEEVAEECIYALKRDDKTIEGPSARMAEIVAYAWGNCRAGARVIDESGEFVTAQGIFWDLEKNTAVGYEVKRRIVNKHGKRYSPDMIGVTANAACAIALRNAVLKGVPKALWVGIYNAARQTIMGDFQTLSSRRTVVIGNFAKFGVSPAQIFAKLEIAGESDITLEHIVILRGILNAIKDGDVSVEHEFAPQAKEGAGAGAALKAAVAGGVAGIALDPLETSIQAETLAEPAPQAVEAGQGSVAGGGVGVTTGGGAAQAQGRSRGTPKLRKTYLEKIEGSTDWQVLDLLFDEAISYDWSAEESTAIKAAYQGRRKTLREGAK